MSSLKDWTAAHGPWVNEFVVTLRRAGVSEAEIGTRLSAAHARCDHEGSFPEQGFGAGQDYARLLGYQATHSEPGDDRSVLAQFYPVAAQVMVLFVGVYAMRGWVMGLDLMLNIGTIVCWIGLGLLLVVMAVLAMKNVRLLLKPWMMLALNVVAIVLGLLGAMFAEADLPVLLEWPSMPVALICAGFIVAVALVATTRELRKSRRPEASDAGVTSRGAARRRAKQRQGRLLGMLVYWLIPVYLGIDAALTAFLGA